MKLDWLKASAGVILLLAVTVSAQTRSKSWIRGTWEGTGYQIDDQSTWTMRVTSNGRRHLIEYPSLDCGGRWKLVSINASQARFKEILSHGQDKCTNNGSVLIRRLSRKQVVFLYSNEGRREVSASAVLNRKGRSR